MQNTTPAQRALVQFVESMIITALITALIGVEPLVAGTGLINWRTTGTVFTLLFMFSVAHSAVAYFRPYNIDLSNAVAQIVDALEVRAMHSMPPAQPQAIQGPLVVVHQQPAAPSPYATAPLSSTVAVEPVATSINTNMQVAGQAPATDVVANP